MIFKVNSESEMISLGKKIGALLNGGEIIDLIGDVGSGKTTLAKGIGVGLGVEENIQSPSYNINKIYKSRDDLLFVHYDFYRLSDAGIMADELKEATQDSDKVIAIEWSDIVKDNLFKDRLSIKIKVTSEASRSLYIDAGGDKSAKVVDKL